MPVFTSCTTESVHVPYVGIRVNKPVNLTTCETTMKSTYEGRKPSIYFHHESGKHTEWCFNTEAERDAEFERILRII